MTTLQLTSLYLMSGFYVFAGVSHFLIPKFFLKIMPRWVPFPEQINLIVGVIEALLGIGLLFPSIQSWSVWGIIALLIAVFPANIYHYQLAKQKGEQVVATIVRLPIQGLLIYWAYTFI